MTTTSRVGVYSEGDDIDFHVRFDKEVVVMSSNTSSPGLLLRMDTGYDNATTVTAYYASGSSSKVLVFAYKVRERFVSVESLCCEWARSRSRKV